MPKDFDSVGVPVPVQPKQGRLELEVSESATEVRDYSGTFEFRIMDTSGDVVARRRGDIAIMPAAIRQKIKDVLDWYCDKIKTVVP